MRVELLMRAGRVGLAVLIACAVLGCAATSTGTGSTTATASKTVGPPKPGQSRVVLMRTGGAGVDWRVQLDGQLMDGLRAGTFVVRDRPPGHHQFMYANAAQLARPSLQEFDTVAGRTYYYRIDLNERGWLVESGNMQAGALPMLVTSAIAAAASDKGLYDFIPLDEKAARAELAALQPAEEVNRAIDLKSGVTTRPLD